MLFVFCYIIVAPYDERWRGVHVILTQSLDLLFLPITEPSKIGSFLTSLTRHGCLMFEKADCDHMLLAVKNIELLCHAFCFCHKPHVADLSVDACLGSFYASKHAVHTNLITPQNEQQSDPRPLKCGFVHTN